ncbi:MAG: hypothetical protein MJK04_29560, partial [Psychrosphaera sp.]|nr:hypothetical protein [Psychrosphaera sp.]
MSVSRIPPTFPTPIPQRTDYNRKSRFNKRTRKNNFKEYILKNYPQSPEDPKTKTTKSSVNYWYTNKSGRKVTRFGKAMSILSGILCAATAAIDPRAIRYGQQENNEGIDFDRNVDNFSGDAHDYTQYADELPDDAKQVANIYDSLGNINARAIPFLPASTQQPTESGQENPSVEVKKGPAQPKSGKSRNQRKNANGHINQRETQQKALKLQKQQELEAKKAQKVDDAKRTALLEQSGSQNLDDDYTLQQETIVTTNADWSAACQAAGQEHCTLAHGAESNNSISLPFT